MVTMENSSIMNTLCVDRTGYDESCNVSGWWLHVDVATLNNLWLVEAYRERMFAAVAVEADMHTYRCVWMRDIAKRRVIEVFPVPAPPDSMWSPFVDIILAITRCCSEVGACVILEAKSA